MSEIPFNIPSGGEPHAQAQTQAQAQAQAQAQTQAQAQALTQAQAQTAATQAGAAAFPPPPQYVVAQQQGMAYPQQPPVAGMMYPQQPYSTYPQNYSPAPAFTQHQAPAPFPQQHTLLHQYGFMQSGSGPYASAAPVYQHFSPVPQAVKRPGPGRPKGSGKKAAAVAVPSADSDDDYTPPSTRRKSKEQRECHLVEIPEIFDWEIEIPKDPNAACSKCGLTKAVFINSPCNHYGWCYECLVAYQATLKGMGKSDACFACKKPIESYLKCFRQTQNGRGAGREFED